MKLILLLLMCVCWACDTIDQQKGDSVKNTKTTPIMNVAQQATPSFETATLALG